MASERHAADSYSKYSLYFDMLELKISKKGIEPKHTYNIDKKGFIIRKIGKQKQVFSRTSYSNKRFWQTLEDGNRDHSSYISRLFLTYYNILKAFKATGLQPLNCDKVLKRFPKGAATLSTPLPPKAGTTAHKIIRKLDSIIGNRYSNKARALCYKIIKETVHAEKLKKANIKELKAANKLYNNKIKEQKRKAAAAAKEVRDRKCAEERVAINARKAQRLKDKQARNAQKASQLPNKGKRKASKAPQAPAAKKRRSAQPRSGAVAAAAAPPRGTHTTHSSRTATLYK
ncbi:uncharacterized protein M421DRAFT_425270 [Didymella exigua CBS 183.55]|uniref:Uncharacterized protein n=1 Tax=Didymella exigua CBS 183.55 TaxID=1150837 RepID=A0A6A5R9J4_9PLEO|nr:uncharacterized protein M421DRAFT_425270 [Didymella exigua CBS 183.55]KAF1923930.1 hypothetical protein M421DRAFT_425270 [Didymella exigua CBS 183.55]